MLSSHKKKYSFVATFDKKIFDSKTNTFRIVLVDILLHGKTYLLFRDHTWLLMSKRFEKLDLKSGDKVHFSAIIYEYLKSDLNMVLGLKHLRNVKKI